MIAQSLVAINVTYVPMPPYFNAATQVPASAWFQLQVNELSPSTTSVTAWAPSGPIQGYSKDGWAVLTYSWLSVPPALTNWFNINAATGAVTLGSAAALDFNVASSYNLTAVVTYAAVGMSDTAAVTIWVREVNKPAVFQALYNATTGAPMAAVVISEATPRYTAVGRIAFVDPNTGFPWNVRNYALLNDGPGAAYFALDSVTGVLSVNAPLSFWDYTGFTLNVTCTDSDPIAPLTTQASIVVTLVQVNTGIITGFGLPNTTLPSEGVPIVAGSSIAFATSGGTVIEIYGSGFGPTALRLASNPSAAATVTATYGLPSVPGTYAAASCVVWVPNTVVRCTTVPGVGTGLAWVLTVNGQWNVTSSGPAYTSYISPTISSVTAASSLLTNGGEYVTVTGVNFATATSPDLIWSYGPLDGDGAKYGPLPCTVSGASTLRCLTAAGIGGALQASPWEWY
jgi:hypothetical protein